MKEIKRVYIAAVVVGAVVGSALGYLAYHREIEKFYAKPNLLILSLCSLRKAELDFYSQRNTDVTPNINRAFKNGIVLDNVYSSYGWTNLALYFLREFDEQFFIKNGYEVVEDDWRPATVTIPGPFTPETDSFPASQAANLITPKLDFLSKRMAMYSPRPFFAFVHIKYMHYPYRDTLNENSGWDRYLTLDEKARVLKIINDPELAKDRIPFALTISGESKVLGAHPELRTEDADPFKAFAGLYNILTDKAALTKWASQPDFADDLAILKKVYRAKMTNLDSIIANLLNLYGRKDFLDNTIVVLMGDHGEAMMEHHLLGHSVHVYDEILTLPFMIRFPRTWRWGAIHVPEQIHMASLVDWMKQMITGENREKDFLKNLPANPRNKYVVSRNCSNNIHSVRFDNRWKLIIDRVNREKTLFDLKSDPQELKNVYEQNPQIAGDLEIYLAGHMQDLDTILDPTPCKD